MSKQNIFAAKAAASMLTGVEPTGSKLDPASIDYRGQLQVIFNWYSAEKTKADAFKYILEYIKKNRTADYKTFQKVNETNVITTFGWLARLVNRGASISVEHRSRLDQHIDVLVNSINLKEITEKAIDIEKKSVVNIQEAIKQKAKEYIGDLEGALDDFIFQDKEFSLYNDFKGKQIPAPYIPEIKLWAQRNLDLYNEVLSSTDSQLVEGYSNFNKKKLKSVVKIFEQFIEDCDKYGQFKKANRKPRAVREKSPAQQIKSLKYKNKDEELNFVSEKPVDMIGASQVWLFNTKNRKLAVYTSDSSKGITIKGTTLQNWDPEKSKQKTLRKPKEQIKELSETGKVKLRTFMDGIKSKESDVNGRINTDTLIIKIMR